MSLFDVLDDGTAEPADDTPVRPQFHSDCKGCGIEPATVGDWCETCYENLI